MELIPYNSVTSGNSCSMEMVKALLLGVVLTAMLPQLTKSTKKAVAVEVEEVVAVEAVEVEEAIELEEAVENRVQREPITELDIQILDSLYNGGLTARQIVKAIRIDNSCIKKEHVNSRLYGFLTREKLVLKSTSPAPIWVSV
jgi:hypothetical protein